MTANSTCGSEAKHVDECQPNGAPPDGHSQGTSRVTAGSNEETKPGAVNPKLPIHPLGQHPATTFSMTQIYREPVEEEE